MTPLVLAFLLLFTVPHPPATQGIGWVTLLEGSLQVIRGTTFYQGVEGMNVKPGDILETSEGAFAQLEFASGAVVALGPSTRLYVVPQAAGGGREHTVAIDMVMLNGWLKHEAAAGKGSYRYRTPQLAVTTSAGTVVVQSNPNTCDIFVESGSASIAEVNQSGGPGPAVPAKVGQFFSRLKGAGITNLERPSTSFLDSMPKQFRDTLPPRQGHFSEKPAEPKAEHPVSYAEIEHWLTAPSAWRRGLAERFAPRLSDPNFRKQIELHEHELPDWGPILHPKTTAESPQVRN
jgi:hypothetical protein